MSHGKWVPADTPLIVKTFKFATPCSMLLPELGTGTTQGDFDMTRQTRMKLAALATAVVATLGVAAIAPATADNAGKSHVTNMRGEVYCC